jgi:large repetitive protein
VKRRARHIALVAGTLALAAAAPAFAAGLIVVSSKLTAWQSATTVPVGCASPGTQTASASDDSWIDQSSPGSNFGADSILKVRSQSGNANFRMLTRFTLPAVPAGCTLTLARLRLYAASATSGRTLQALRVNAAWAQNTVTWTNQPATTGAAVTTTSGAGYREWTVTPQVALMYSGTNNGFLIRDATESGVGPEQAFHSREKAPDNPPQLGLTFG